MNPTTTAAVRFAAVYATLHAAHQLGDHVVQTDAQAIAKAARVGWSGAMAGHIGSYHTTAAVMLAAADRTLNLGLSRWRVAAGLALSAGTHAVLDRRWPVRWILQRTGSAAFAQMIEPLHGVYLADQALHSGCLWLAALTIAGNPESSVRRRFGRRVSVRP